MRLDTRWGPPWEVRTAHAGRGGPSGALRRPEGRCVAGPSSSPVGLLTSGGHLLVTVEDVHEDILLLLRMSRSLLALYREG